MIASFITGLREGLEAAIVVGILLAYVRRVGRADVASRIWLGVGFAIAISLAIGALLTFGTYGLTQQATEIIGGSLSIFAVGLVTWMIFWMGRTASNLKQTLESDVARVLEGSAWGLVLIGFVSVAREGLETALFLWSIVRSSGDTVAAVIAAVVGLVVAALLGALIYRGMVRINLAKFFFWTGLVLIFVAAGVLAYACGDLQEARVLPGPFGYAGDSWFAGWAFQLSGSFDPSGVPAALLQGTIGFTPDMTRLQVGAWAVYLVVVMTAYLLQHRRLRASAAPQKVSQ